MKIGLLHYTMPPVIGGVERVIAAHARLFRENGHEVALYCEGRQEEWAADLPWVAVPGFSEDSAVMSGFFEAEDLDLLIVHNVFTMPFSLAATAACHTLAAGGFPIVSWVHDMAACNPHYQIGPESLIRKHAAGCRVVAISEERAASYRAMTGFADVKIIPNGIDAIREIAAKFSKNHPAEAQKIRGAFPILFLPARILRRKNITLAIQTIAELKALGLDARLLISGAPEPFSGGQSQYRSVLDQLVAMLGVAEEILFLSDSKPISDAEINELYGVADALIFPSEQEGFGLPILEAAARGLPVFASRSQPLADLAAQNGFTFAPNVPPAELSRRISRFLAENAGSHIRQAVRRDFDWQGIYSRHILPFIESFSL